MIAVFLAVEADLSSLPWAMTATKIAYHQFLQLVDRGGRQMSIDLNLPCAFQLQKLRMENHHGPSTFISVHCCIQKIYGLVCTVQRHHEPSARRVNVSFFWPKNDAEI